MTYIWGTASGGDPSAVIPEPRDRARCKTCLDEGYIDVTGCTCIPRGGAHEPMCGTMPCPEGCSDA